MLWGQLLAGLRAGLSGLKMAKNPSENEKYKTVKRRDAPFFCQTAGNFSCRISCFETKLVLISIIVPKVTYSELLNHY
jgi:hypothetical protein